MQMLTYIVSSTPHPTSKPWPKQVFYTCSNVVFEYPLPFHHLSPLIIFSPCTDVLAGRRKWQSEGGSPEHSRCRSYNGSQHPKVRGPTEATSDGVPRFILARYTQSLAQAA